MHYRGFLFVIHLKLKFSRYIRAKYDEQHLVCLLDKSLFEEAKSFALQLKELFTDEFLSGDDAKFKIFCLIL